jgi:hypothetical protein
MIICGQRMNNESKSVIFKQKNKNETEIEIERGEQRKGHRERKYR